MVLYFLRGAFILLAATVTALYVLPFQELQQIEFRYVVLMLGGTVAFAGLIIAVDASTKHKKLSAISGVFLGLIAGLLAAYALSFVIDLVGVLTAPGQPEQKEAYLLLLRGVKVLIGLITCYIGISLVLQTKDDFRFVLPYVEFTKQIRGNRPTLLDSSVIVDGRILDIIETRTMQGVLIVPKFILNELQLIADSSDKLKRARGRRGLEVLQKLQDSAIIEVIIEDRDAEGGTVDQQLISLGQEMQARVMTNDYNLNKIAQLRGVEVINLNDLAKALRPVVLPGEHMHIRIVKAGEGPSQGVGYLEDGTMVVVEEGKGHVAQNCQIVVTSTLQTSAGRMIFGRYEKTEETTPVSPAHSAPPPQQPVVSHTTTGPPHTPRTTPSRRNPRRSR